jgi:hypothetical protein
MNVIECFVNEEEVDLYLDKELPGERATLLDKHLDLCRNCAIRYRLALELKHLTRKSVLETKAPADLRDRIVQGIESIAREEPVGFWGRLTAATKHRPLVPVGIAGALVAVFLLALFVRPTPTRTMPLVTAMIEEHNEYVEDFHTDRGIISGDPAEVGRWLKTNAGMDFVVPTGDAMPAVFGACTLVEDDLSVTCLFFMIAGNTPKLTSQKIYEVKNRRLHCGNCTGDNYVAWNNAGILCLLVSKLPEGSLVKMAESLI